MEREFEVKFTKECNYTEAQKILARLAELVEELGINPEYFNATYFISPGQSFSDQFDENNIDRDNQDQYLEDSDPVDNYEAY